MNRLFLSWVKKRFKLSISRSPFTRGLDKVPPRERPLDEKLPSIFSMEVEKILKKSRLYPSDVNSRSTEVPFIASTRFWAFFEISRSPRKLSFFPWSVEDAKSRKSFPFFPRSLISISPPPGILWKRPSDFTSACTEGAVREPLTLTFPLNVPSGWCLKLRIFDMIRGLKFIMSARSSTVSSLLFISPRKSAILPSPYRNSSPRSLVLSEDISRKISPLLLNCFSLSRPSRYVTLSFFSWPKRSLTLNSEEAKAPFFLLKRAFISTSVSVPRNLASIVSEELPRTRARCPRRFISSDTAGVFLKSIRVLDSTDMS